jgi:hypothetical protein
VVWVNVAGLAFDIAGAIILSFGLFLTQREAIDLGVTRWPYGTDEENLALPTVRSLLRQSRNAKIGLPLLVTGFALQLVAAWPVVAWRRGGTLPLPPASDPGGD